MPRALPVLAAGLLLCAAGSGFAIGRATAPGNDAVRSDDRGPALFADLRPPSPLPPAAEPGAQPDATGAAR